MKDKYFSIPSNCLFSIYRFSSLSRIFSSYVLQSYQFAVLLKNNKIVKNFASEERIVINKLNNVFDQNSLFLIVFDLRNKKCEENKDGYDYEVRTHGITFFIELKIILKINDANTFLDSLLYNNFNFDFSDYFKDSEITYKDISINYLLSNLKSNIEEFILDSLNKQGIKKLKENSFENISSLKNYFRSKQVVSKMNELGLEIVEVYPEILSKELHNLKKKETIDLASSELDAKIKMIGDGPDISKRKSLKNLDKKEFTFIVDKLEKTKKDHKPYLDTYTDKRAVEESNNKKRNSKFCSECGKENKLTAKFCIDCGEKI